LRQLQQANGLLQLWRKSQLLIETELKPWFHACQKGLADLILTPGRNRDHS
jgi:hypothetical protein